MLLSFLQATSMNILNGLNMLGSELVARNSSLSITAAATGVLLISASATVYWVLFHMPGDNAQRRKKVVTKIIDEDGTRVSSANTTDEELNVFEEPEATVCDYLLRHCEQRQNEDFLGYHTSPTAPYQWITFKTFLTSMKNVGSGLIEVLNLSSHESEYIGIFAINSIEWVTCHYGLAMYSHVIVPLYATLGEVAVAHIIKQTEMRSCIVENQSKLDILFAAAKECSKLKNIIVMYGPLDKSKLPSEAKNYNIFTLDDVKKIGSKNIKPFKKPTKKDLYVINYTSGTTGFPKGVLITHEMIFQTITTVLATGNSAKVNSADIYFSFLPLAHIFEQLMIAVNAYMGCRIGFFSGKIDNLIDDMKTLKPTFLALVPRLLCRIYDKSMARINRSSVVKYIVGRGVAAKLRSIEDGTYSRTTIYDKLFFKRIQASLGGNVRQVITGSAACPTDVLDFCRAAFGSVIFMGYGQTETCGVISLTYADDGGNNHVGVPIRCSKVRLMDVPDMDIISSRDARGEVCVKGVNCSAGYFKDAEKTKDLIDEDGWLHTGDIGEWDERGCLRIVDRCKNIFKLSQGEYIAPDKVEGVYSLSPVVEQILVDGRSDKNFAIAVVKPDMSVLAKGIGVLVSEDGAKQSLTPQELVERDDAKQYVLEALNKIATQNKLVSFEQAKKIILIHEPFSIENGLLTPTLKTCRAKVRERYAKEIAELYV